MNLVRNHCLAHAYTHTNHTNYTRILAENPTLVIQNFCIPRPPSMDLKSDSFKRRNREKITRKKDEKCQADLLDVKLKRLQNGAESLKSKIHVLPRNVSEISLP